MEEAAKNLCAAIPRLDHLLLAVPGHACDSDDLAFPDAQVEPAQDLGRGPGVDDDGLARKRAAIEESTAFLTADGSALTCREALRQDEPIVDRISIDELSLPLFWRVCLINGTVFLLGTLVLVLAPVIVVLLGAGVAGIAVVDVLRAEPPVPTWQSGPSVATGQPFTAMPS